MSPDLGTDGDLRLFSGRSNPELSEEIAAILGVQLGAAKISTFNDTEIHVQLEESVRGADIFIIQSTGPPVNENLMELLVMIDACSRASARQVTAVIPYFGYARQDHKSTGREPITARLVADLLTAAGADRVIALDLHASQIQGFFNIPMDHLTSTSIIAHYFQEKGVNGSNTVLVSPDVGRAKLTEKYADLLGLPMVLSHKRRTGVGGHDVRVVEIVGDVEGKTPIIIDDLISSGSVYQQAEALVERGANPAYIAVTHAVFVGPYVERLSSPAIREIVVTNSLQVTGEKLLGGRVKVLSIAPLLATVISRVHLKQSVSKVFSDENIVFPV